MELKDLKDEEWKNLVRTVSTLRNILNEKPVHLKLGFQRNHGGILNAYREGDITFEETIKELEEWAQKKND